MSRGELRERLAERRVLLLDGGLGSELIAAGLELGRAPESWNLEHPARVLAVHQAYVDAGSEVIHTNTFGGSPLKLAQAGLAPRWREINQAAVALARQAAGERAWVAGDLGPCGALFAPMGEAAAEQVSQTFLAQAEVLAEAGADLLSIETMYDLREAQLALAAARRTGLPVMVFMTFEAKARGAFTMVGDPLGPSLQALAAAGADAVGLNCSVTAAQMVPLAAQALDQVQAPIFVQPNAGQPRAQPSGELVYDADPGAFCADLLRMVALGVLGIGGCCGTTPAFIRATRQALDQAP